MSRTEDESTFALAETTWRLLRNRAYITRIYCPFKKMIVTHVAAVNYDVFAVSRSVLPLVIILAEILNSTSL